MGILRKVLFFEKVPEYDSGVMNKDKQGTACDAVLIDKEKKVTDDGCLRVRQHNRIDR